MPKQTPAQKRASAKRMLEKKLPADPKVKAEGTALTAREINRLLKAL